MPTMDKELQKLVAGNKHLKFSDDKSRVVCIPTGHEMVLRLAEVERYMTTNKFKKAVETAEHDFAQYLPHIEPSKKDPDNLLYCNITGKLMKKDATLVLQHVNSKRYKRMKMEKDNKGDGGANTEEDNESEGLWVPEDELVQSDEEIVQEKNIKSKQKKRGRHDDDAEEEQDESDGVPFIADDESGFEEVPMGGSGSEESEDGEPLMVRKDPAVTSSKKSKKGGQGKGGVKAASRKKTKK